jgi:signal transduction histidine kinase
VTNSHGGIRVYKNGFRVYPYGGPDDDWLGIDQSKTTHGGRSPDETFADLSNSLELHTEFDKALLSMPTNRNLIGRVLISADADLTMASNREDFLENELFDELKKILRLSLQWLTLQWSHYKASKAKKELQEQTKKFKEETEEDRGDDSDDDNPSESESDEEPVDSALHLLEGVADTATETVPEEERQVSNEAVETATKVIRNTLDQREQEIDFFRSAFSVNQVVFSFSHELRSMVNDLGSSASRIEAVIDKLPEEQQPRFNEVVSDLERMQDRFENQMELFGIFMETGTRKQATQQKVQEVVDDVIDATEYIAGYYNVKMSTDIPSLLRTPPMYKSELYSIVINLVTNSIKAVGTSPKEGNKIHVKGDKTDDGIRLRVYDNGVGIPEEAREEAFEPLVSDPVNNIYDNLTKEMPMDLSEHLGKGTGLGLSIVRNIAEKYDGHARFVDNEEWSTCVEVTINE